MHHQQNHSPSFSLKLEKASPPSPKNKEKRFTLWSAALLTILTLLGYSLNQLFCWNIDYIDFLSNAIPKKTQPASADGAYWSHPSVPAFPICRGPKSESTCCLLTSREAHSPEWRIHELQAGAASKDPHHAHCKPGQPALLQGSNCTVILTESPEPYAKSRAHLTENLSFCACNFQCVCAALNHQTIQIITNKKHCIKISVRPFWTTAARATQGTLVRRCLSQPCHLLLMISR